MSLFKKILTLGGNETYDRAMNHYNRAEYEEAIREFDKITKFPLGGGRLYPRLALFYEGQAYRNLGLVEMHQGRFAEAVPKFEKAAQLTPENVEIHLYLGLSYNNEGRYEDAVQELTLVVREEPRDVQGYLRLASALTNAGRLPEAEEQLRKAIRMEKGYADLHFLLANVLVRKGEHAAAAASFEEAIRLNDKYLEAYARLGYTFGFLSDWEKAKEKIRKALSLSPADPSPRESLLLLEEGTTKGNDAFLQKGHEAFSAALTIDPRAADTFMALQKAQRDIGFYNTLVQIYQNAVHDHPNYADFHYGLGNACHQLERRKEAIQHYEKALSINPNYIQAQIALGYCYKEIGNREAAKKIFEQLAAKETHHPEVFFQLGLLLGEEGELDRAITLIEKALAMRRDLEGAKEALEALRKKRRGLG